MSRSCIFMRLLVNSMYCHGGEVIPGCEVEGVIIGSLRLDGSNVNANANATNQ